MDQVNLHELASKFTFLPNLKKCKSFSYLYTQIGREGKYEGKLKKKLFPIAKEHRNIYIY